MINLHWQSYELLINTYSAAYLSGQEVRVKPSPYFMLSHCLTMVERLAVLLQHFDSRPLLQMDRERPQINTFPPTCHIMAWKMENGAGRVKGRLQWISQMCDWEKKENHSHWWGAPTCVISLQLFPAPPSDQREGRFAWSSSETLFG